jgi:hypothetical protein
MQSHDSRPNHARDQKAKHDIIDSVHSVVRTIPKLARYGHSNLTERRDRTPLPAALVVEELNACFVVRDHSQQLAYVYFEDEPGAEISRRDQ